ncbi:MAG: VOC family protein [Chloroflexi bacterium]|nr:VOC family protein [Chloroflexota bacterium]
MATGFELLSMRPNLPVRDLAAAVAFYRDVLGFGVAHEDAGAGFALMRGGGAELALVSDEASLPQGAYLYVTAVETAYRRCADAGAHITYELTLEPWGLRNFVVEDPSANKIAIGEWMAQGGQA